MRSTLLIIIAALLTLTVAACGDDDGRRTDGPPVLMTARALPAAPDGTVTVEWYLDLARGWHLYWPGRNDSGFPPSLKLDLPTGWSARPLRWPVPERHLLADGLLDDLLDHVYDMPLVVLEQVLVPPDPVAAADRPLTATWRWLACRNECVPGDTTLTFTVPFRLEAATKAPPGAAPVYPTTLPTDAFTTTWDGATLVVRAPGAGALRFFPATDCGRLENLPADGEARGDELRLRFLADGERVGPVRGLLQIDDAAGVRLTGPLDMPDTTVAAVGA